MEIKEWRPGSEQRRTRHKKGNKKQHKTEIKINQKLKTEIMIRN